MSHTESITTHARQRGQSTLEYAIIIAVVVAALLAMQIYMKRGVQGKLRSAADDVGGQFSPAAYEASYKTVQKSATEETLHVGNQLAGESKSETTTEGGITDISSDRTSLDTETLTDAESNDRLFTKTDTGD